MMAIVGCGPSLVVDEPTDGSTETMTDAESGEFGGSAFGGSSGSIDDEPTGEGGGATGGSATPPPCDRDPNLLDPWRPELYRTCMRGLAFFDAQIERNGSAFFHAYAQFYDVESYVRADYEEEILDPWSGPEDCGLVRHGNSAFGGEEVVLWEDAGEVMFHVGGDATVASKYGDPVSVLGYDWPGESSEPVYGVPHGFSATGATTPAFSFHDAVTLPPPLEAFSLALDGTATLGTTSTTLSWIPASPDAFVRVFIRVPVDGDWDYTLYCTAPDARGQIELPAGLLAQLPRPSDAHVFVQRSNRTAEEAESGRFIQIWANTSMGGDVHLQ